MMPSRSHWRICVTVDMPSRTGISRSIRIIERGIGGGQIVLDDVVDVVVVVVDDNDDGVDVDDMSGSTPTI